MTGTKSVINPPCLGIRLVVTDHSKPDDIDDVEIP